MCGLCCLTKCLNGRMGCKGGYVFENGHKRRLGHWDEVRWRPTSPPVRHAKCRPTLGKPLERVRKSPNWRVVFASAFARPIIGPGPLQWPARVPACSCPTVRLPLHRPACKAGDHASDRKETRLCVCVIAPTLSDKDYGQGLFPAA